MILYARFPRETENAATTFQIASSRSASRCGEAGAAYSGMQQVLVDALQHLTHEHMWMPQENSLHVQVPFTQVSLFVVSQVLPHVPQLLSSFLVSVHRPPQTMKGAGPQTHWPFEHIVPVAHVPGHCTIAPQLFGAEPHCRPVHAVPLSVHPQPLAPAPPPPHVFGGAHVLGHVMG